MEEFVPTSKWSNNSNAHNLLVKLPAFKLENVRIVFDNTGHINISGERQVHSDKTIYFDQSFELPENSDMDNITAEFQNEILYVTVPKQAQNQLVSDEDENGINQLEHSSHEYSSDEEQYDASEKNKRNENNKRNYVDSFREELLKKWEEEAGSGMETTLELIKNNAIVAAAVLAFSLGVLVAWRF
ncbi:inactive protein RESTRICTED TEV MOVEMENT 2-like [Carica papaya]|uniref:inactive protein RESTRICTED TEV MOVEMENT 2-like n=1 Tax=Carica papaya TaxID=3649 RepID=UPI000B8CAFC7|nr:inactive protein RESTRICTED TEV MOVEMENT 2-like [Carica papaya]